MREKDREFCKLCCFLTALGSALLGFMFGLLLCYFFT